MSGEMAGRKPGASRIATAVQYLLALGGSLVLLFPLWWMVMLSLSPRAEAQAALSRPAEVLWPRREPQWKNYPEALRALGAASAPAPEGEEVAAAATANWDGFLDALANSVVITTLCVAGNVLSCSLVGYALARMRFRGRDGLFVLTLATMMLPAQVTMIPLFLLFRTLGWLDTFLPLVAPSFLGSAFFIFMFRQFFAQVSEELVEAARIDGASNVGIWWRIMLPLCAPVAAITAIFTFIWTWNDFMNPLIYLYTPERFTLALALNNFKSQFGGTENTHRLMAAAVVCMVPCVVLFLAAQRHFVRGLNVGGVKG